MSKKIIAAVLVLLIAVVIYICVSLTQNKNTAEEIDETETNAEETAAENSYLSKNADEIISLTLEKYNEDGSVSTLEFTKSDGGSFIINGYSDVTYNDGIINSLMNYIAQLNYTDVISEPNNLEEYGLSSPALKANAKYSDGTETTVLLGSRTQDLSYYYVMFNDDKAVYISLINNYNMYKYDLSDFIYKYIPPITKESIMYLDVIQKGKDEIEIAFLEEKEGNAADLASYGMQTLTMLKPLEGTAVYPTNLQETVLSGASLLTLGNVYKLNPSEEDIAACGLDDPFLQIKMTDGNESSLSLNIGNKADESSYYCMTPLYPHIFTISDSGIESFIDINILDFTEKFVQLVYRGLVSSIEFIENGEKTYTVKFNGENMATAENQKDTRQTTINDVEIAYDDFGKFYQIFAGITFDSFVDSVSVNEEPEIEFIIYMTDGTQKSIKYFNYADDVNFYVIQEDDLPLTKLVSKRSVKEVFDKAAELTAS